MAAEAMLRAQEPGALDTRVIYLMVLPVPLTYWVNLGTGEEAIKMVLPTLRHEGIYAPDQI